MKKIGKGYMMEEMLRSSLLSFILANLSSTIGVVIDGIIIGHGMNMTSVAAYGLALPLNAIVSAICVLFSSGLQVVCAQYVGRADVRKANRAFCATNIIMLLVSVLFMLTISIFRNSIANMLLMGRVEPELLGEVKQSLIGYTLNILPLVFLPAYTLLMKLDGDQFSIKLAIACMIVLNIIGDVLSVVYHLGMFGISMTTAISNFIAVLALLTHFLRKERNFKLFGEKPDWKLFCEVVKVGFPQILSRLSSAFRIVVLNALLMMYGSSVAVAALSVQSSINCIVGCVGYGLGLSALTIAGILTGEENRIGLKLFAKVAIKKTIILTGIVGGFTAIAAPLLVKVFTNDADVIKVATIAIRYFGVYILLFGVNTVLTNFFQASGNLVLANITYVCDRFLCIALVAVLLGNVYGVNGIWIAFPVGEIIVLVVLTIIIRVRLGHFPRSLEDFILLPKNLGIPDDMCYSVLVTDTDEAIQSGRNVRDFCRKTGASEEQAHVLSMFTEEIAKNILRHDLYDKKAKGKKQMVVDLYIMRKKDRWILHIRDNGKSFDMKKYIEDRQDKGECKIIRAVFNMAIDVQYVNSLNFNNLTVCIDDCFPNCKCKLEPAQFNNA